MWLFKSPPPPFSHPPLPLCFRLRQMLSHIKLESQTISSINIFQYIDHEIMTTATMLPMMNDEICKMTKIYANCTKSKSNSFMWFQFDFKLYMMIASCVTSLNANNDRWIYLYSFANCHTLGSISDVPSSQKHSNSSKTHATCTWNLKSYLSHKLKQ